MFREQSWKSGQPWKFVLISESFVSKQQCLQRPSQTNRKYKKKADRKVYFIPFFLGDAEYQSLRAAFIAAWDCSLGMISVYHWLFPWFFIYSIFLRKQNKPSFLFMPVQFL